jgi:hypothetical protein
LNRCLNSDKVLLFKLPSILASVHDVLPPVPLDYVLRVVLIEQLSVADCRIQSRAVLTCERNARSRI